MSVHKSMLDLKVFLEYNGISMQYCMSFHCCLVNSETHYSETHFLSLIYSWPVFFFSNGQSEIENFILILVFKGDLFLLRKCEAAQ